VNPFRLSRRAIAIAAMTAVAATSAAAAAAFPTLPARTAPARTAPDGAVALPFGIGERAEYEVKFGGIAMGRGHMEVVGEETVRGRETLHTRFHIRGGPFFFKVDDRLESWIDPREMMSVRFRQELNEGSRERERTFEFYPERAVYREAGKEGEQPSVSNPLDDASFIYFVRTVPLEVGKEYAFDRYFIPDRNPVRLKVIRRERIRVPAGDFDAVVVQPIISARGIFSESGRAEIWFSDDDRRIMLQMKSRFARISLSLHLKSYRPPTTALPAPASR
jgi:hypothetical protein